MNEIENKIINEIKKEISDLRNIDKKTGTISLYFEIDEPQMKDKNPYLINKNKKINYKNKIILMKFINYFIIEFYYSFVSSFHFIFL